MTRFTALLGAAALSFGAGMAMAAPVNVSAVLTPQEQIRVPLEDGTKHFVLAVRRTGEMEGEGAFAGADVTEIGWHDIDPPRGGDPQGYLKLTMANGDVAVLRFTVRAVFFKGAEGPSLSDYGFWELVGGTGGFEGMRGVGTLQIHPAGGPKREFTLTGEVGEAP